MAEVVWSVNALDDLQAIVEHIAKRSPATAAGLGERILDAPDRLLDFPESGSIVPEFNRDDIRELLVGTYRIIYWHRFGICRIVVVASASRDLSRLLHPDHLP